ncbi:methyltransferase domain-containing protein [bacterium]|nr:methyltransferase domain-containing protein [bacterium]
MRRISGAADVEQYAGSNSGAAGTKVSPSTQSFRDEASSDHGEPVSSASDDRQFDGLRRGEAALAEIDALERLIADARLEYDATSLRASEVRHPTVRSVTEIRRVETLPCVVCHGTTAVTRYVIDGQPECLVVCDTCGLGSLLPMPDRKRLASFSPGEPGVGEISDRSLLTEFGGGLSARLRVRSLLRGVPRGGRVLAVGSRSLLTALSELGYAAHGLATSTAIAATSDRRVRVAPDLVAAGFDSRAFDAVILWHVFDRQPQPGEILDELRRILQPGGRLVIAVPNFASWQSRTFGADWSQLDLPRQLYQFSPDTLHRLLRRHDFACESIRHFPLRPNAFSGLQSWLNRVTATPRNSLEELQDCDSRHPDVPALSWQQRTLLKLSYGFGLPVAACVALVEALTRQSSTMTVTARAGNLQTVDAILCRIAPGRLANAFA